MCADERSVVMHSQDRVCLLNDSSGLGRDYTESVNVRHDIVYGNPTAIPSHPIRLEYQHPVCMAGTGEPDAFPRLTPPLLFLYGGDLELFLIEVQVGLHLLDGLVRDGQSQFLSKNASLSTLTILGWSMGGLRRGG